MTFGGTATNPTDYGYAGNDPIEFSMDDFDDYIDITITLVDDNTLEDRETITVTLGTITPSTGATNVLLREPIMTTIYIKDVTSKYADAYVSDSLASRLVLNVYFEYSQQVWG